MSDGWLGSGLEGRECLARAGGVHQYYVMLARTLKIKVRALLYLFMRRFSSAAASPPTSATCCLLDAGCLL